MAASHSPDSTETQLFPGKNLATAAQGRGVAIKQSVYVLPESETAREDLSWIAKEIDEGGGTASICRTVFIEGLADNQIKQLFRTARDADYREIVQEVRSLIDSFRCVKDFSGDVLKNRSKLSRLRHRFNEIGENDFFSAPERKAADELLRTAELMLKKAHGKQVPAPMRTLGKGRAWVTRAGVYVDRIACVWLIRRFIDPDARFKFVPPDGYRHRSGEYRFDMFEAEFSHEGDLCTFEVLVSRFYLTSPAVCAVSEVIHDIDLKENKFSRPETQGIRALFSGMAATYADDDTRVKRGERVLDELYAYFEARCSDKFQDGSPVESVNFTP